MTADFSEKIDAMIEDLAKELNKVRKARVNSKTHVNFVTQEINSSIQRLSSKNPDDSVKVLGDVLTSIPNIIENSFERLNTIEGNIVVAIQSYQRVKEAYVAHQNEAKQAEQQSLGEDGQEEPDSISQVSLSNPLSSDDQVRSGIRKLGTRPVDKLASRREKSSKGQDLDQEKPKKRATKKRKSSKSKKEK